MLLMVTWRGRHHFWSLPDCTLGGRTSPGKMCLWLSSANFNYHYHHKISQLIIFIITITMTMTTPTILTTSMLKSSWGSLSFCFLTFHSPRRTFIRCVWVLKTLRCYQKIKRKMKQKHLWRYITHDFFLISDTCRIKWCKRIISDILEEKWSRGNWKWKETKQLRCLDRRHLPEEVENRNECAVGWCWCQLSWPLLSSVLLSLPQCISSAVPTLLPKWATRQDQPSIAPPVQAGSTLHSVLSAEVGTSSAKLWRDFGVFFRQDQRMKKIAPIAQAAPTVRSVTGATSLDAPSMQTASFVQNARTVCPMVSVGNSARWRISPKKSSSMARLVDLTLHYSKVVAWVKKKS